MYVCICKQVTDKDVRKAIAEGATTMRQLCRQLPLGKQCGRCCLTAKEILRGRNALLSTALLGRRVSVFCLENEIFLKFNSLSKQSISL